MTRKLSNRTNNWSSLATASFHGKILEMQNAGEKIIDLTIGISNIPMPMAGKKAAIWAIESDSIAYTSIGGSIKLKKAISEKLLRDNKIKVDTSQIIVTQGAKQAIFQALYCLTNPSDEVLLFTPYWPAYTQILSFLKLKPIFLKLQDIEHLAKIKRENLKAIVFDNPHVPSGKVISPSDLKQIAQFAKQNNLSVITDESYEKLNYLEKNYSLFNLDEKLRESLVTIYSISQSYSMMGWRLGYAIANKELISAMEGLQSSITASVSGLTQETVTTILLSDQSYSKKLRAVFKKRRDSIYKELTAISWMSLELPQAGPYFWCNIERLTKDSIGFCEKLFVREKIAILAGDTFGSKGWVRIAFNTQPTKTLKIAVRKIAKFGSDYEQK